MPKWTNVKDIAAFLAEKNKAKTRRLFDLLDSEMEAAGMNVVPETTEQVVKPKPLSVVPTTKKEAVGKYEDAALLPWEKVPNIDKKIGWVGLGATGASALQPEQAEASPKGWVSLNQQSRPQEESSSPQSAKPGWVGLGQLKAGAIPLPPSTSASVPMSSGAATPEQVKAIKQRAFDQSFTGGPELGLTPQDVQPNLVNEVAEEKPELGLVSSLALGGASAVAASKAMKLMKIMPHTPWKAAIAMGLAAAPIYEFAEGVLVGRSAMQSLKELVPHSSEEGDILPFQPGEMFWWGATPPIASGLWKGVKAGVPPLLKGVDRMMHGPLKSVTKPLEPLGDKIVSVLVKPAQLQLPYFHKSVQEMIQPGVERLAKDIPRVAQTFRKSSAMRSLTTQTGKLLGREMEGLTPSERYEVTRALRGHTITSPKVQRLIDQMDDQYRAADLKGKYEMSVRDNIGQLMTKQFASAEGGMSDTQLKGLLTSFDQMVVNKGKVNVKSIHGALDDVIRNPLVPDETKAFARELYDIPANTPVLTYEASNKASMEYLVSKLQATPGMVKAVDTPGYLKSQIGGMGHAFVQRDVELELRAMRDVPKYSRGFYQKWFLGPWKTGKVVVRPATHMRNLISNTILNDWGGLPFWRVDVYAKAVAEMRREGPMWKDFVKRTGAQQNFTQTEVRQLEAGMRHGDNMFDKAYHLYDRMVEPFGKAYSAEENLFKLAKYMHNLEGGAMNKSDAALDAMKWTFNYGEVTPEIAKIGQIAMPFVRWYSKSIPLLLETAVKHPVRLAKWFAMAHGLQTFAADQVGVSDDEWGEIEKNLPEYMKKGMYLMMPWRDEKERLNLMNLTYIVPGIGDIKELGSRSIPEVIFQNPIITTAAALSSKKKYSGAPLYYDWEDAPTKFTKATKYVWEQLSPALVPGGTDWNSMWRAAFEEGTDTQTPEQALAGFFGFKLTPVDPASHAKRKEVIDKIHQSEMSAEMQRELKKSKSADETSSILQRYQQIREKQFSLYGQ